MSHATPTGTASPARLDPVDLLRGLFERGTPAVLSPVPVFGRVPMFYYLRHIPFVPGLSHVWFVPSAATAATRGVRAPRLQ